MQSNEKEDNWGGFSETEMYFLFFASLLSFHMCSYVLSTVIQKKNRGTHSLEN